LIERIQTSSEFRFCTIRSNAALSRVVRIVNAFTGNEQEQGQTIIVPDALRMERGVSIAPTKAATFCLM
jgi:acetyl/propionyl-CoA carboxylase alpha subunit